MPDRREYEDWNSWIRGVISNTYIQEIQRIYEKTLEIVAVADMDQARAKASAEKYQVPFALTVEELLAYKDIQLIVNLTPPMAHKELNMRILESGKHLFCEKPYLATDS